jgi:hypothetical protein
LIDDPDPIALLGSPAARDGWGRSANENELRGSTDAAKLRGKIKRFALVAKNFSVVKVAGRR